MARIYTPRIPAMVRRILQNEDWFGNGDPTWWDMQSEEEAERSNRERVRILRRAAAALPQCFNLSEILASCEEESRCGSGACAMCSRAIQRWTVVRLEELYREANISGYRPVMWTVASHAGRWDDLGEPLPYAMLDVRKYFLKGYAEAGLMWLAGGLDIEFYDRNGCYLDVHTHVFTTVKNPRKLEAVLRNWVSEAGTDQGRNLVKWQEWDGTPKGNSYPFKYSFPKPAAPDEVKARLMLAFHALGLSDRLILKGVKRHLKDRAVRLTWISG